MLEAKQQLLELFQSPSGDSLFSDIQARQHDIQNHQIRVSIP